MLINTLETNKWKVSTITKKTKKRNIATVVKSHEFEEIQGRKECGNQGTLGGSTGNGEMKL